MRRAVAEITLDRLMERSDAVLAVQLLDDRIEEETHLPGALPWSLYTFTVRDAVKGAFRPGDLVKIARMGGRWAFEDDFPRPGLGERFVVFLGRRFVGDGFVDLEGPWSTFRIENGQVRPIGPGFPEWLGRDADDFVKGLKAIAGRNSAR